jgi:alpha/beta hydrolase family protein
MPDTRHYFFAGVTHGPGSLPMNKNARYLSNPLDHRPVHRALLAAFQAWLKDGVAPPASVYPKLSAGQLTAVKGLKFPSLEGVIPPARPRLARRLDFGPDFEKKGIISQEPPAVKGAFPMLVPQLDADGNELGGIRLPEMAVPLATIAGWNLRPAGTGAPEEIQEMTGSTFPFPATKEDRVRTRDPRTSVAERYTGREDYLKRAAEATDQLIANRLILPRDRSLVIERAGKLWDALVH